MGQKVHPYGFRLGIIRDWKSRWYADREYKDFAIEDHKIRKYLRARLPQLIGGARRPGAGGRGGRTMEVGVSTIEIERMANMIKVTMHTARPGMIIGRGGRGIDELRAELEKVVPRRVQLNVLEIKQPELDAQLVAESIGSQIERRISFKRAVRMAIARTMQRGGKGIKVLVGGRLGGAEIARSYGDKDGKVPLHTLRADIDYGTTEAKTTNGHIGVKVWIYRGDILPKAPEGPARPPVARPAVAAPTPVGVPAPEAKVTAKGWRRVAREPMASEETEAPTEVIITDAAAAQAEQTFNAEPTADSSATPGAGPEATDQTE
jgi:small subunit ribosomal protein S3